MSYDPNTAYPSGPGEPGPQGFGYDATPRGATSPEDLTLPLYGASFGQAIKRFFKKYTHFTGRASRSEFWFAQLFIFLITLIPNALYGIGAGSAALSIATSAGTSQMSTTPSTGGTGLALIGGILLFIVTLAILIPYLAITWRRLHDANLSGAFWFLSFVPFVGGIVVLVMTILPSKPEGQRFDV